jgi:hypothetical protein
MRCGCCGGVQHILPILGIGHRHRGYPVAVSNAVFWPYIRMNLDKFCVKVCCEFNFNMAVQMWVSVNTPVRSRISLMQQLFDHMSKFRLFKKSSAACDELDGYLMQRHVIVWNARSMHISCKI